MAKKILCFAVFVILTISLIFFSSSSFLLVDMKAFAQNKTQTPIRLELAAWATDYLPFIAQEKGYFTQNKVNVQLTLVPDYLQFIHGYSSGQYDGIMTLYSDMILLIIRE
jgi:ABC-type nitrate/sulfonate/bicarbonate transport system substrate-binding protein